jgi:hypothetical protein
MRIRNFRHYLHVAVAAVPHAFAECPRQNDASLGSAARVLFGISVHQESAAAKGLSVCRGLEPQNVRTMTRAVPRRPYNSPFTARDGADVGDAFHSRIILAFTGAGIAGGRVPAILLKLACVLRVGPSEGLEVGAYVLFILTPIKSILSFG